MERLPCSCVGRCQGPVFHASEAHRIEGEIGRLGQEFSADGPVRWILGERVREERERARRGGDK